MLMSKKSKQRKQQQQESTDPKVIKKLAKKKRTRTFFFVTFTVLFCLFVTGCLTTLVVGNVILTNLTEGTNGEVLVDLDAEKDEQNQTTILYATDSDGETVEVLRLHSTENRIWADYDEMPQDLLWAFVCLEDSRFYDHSGVDWIRTIAVMINPAYAGQGASTITQQLIKNITEDDDVTYFRKWYEIIRALNMEDNYSKTEILEAYLNTIYLGEGCYGVQTAAETYFGKDLDELNLAECAILASITQSPYSLNPFTNDDGSLEERQQYCLYSMLEEGKITQEEYDEALATEIVLNYDYDDDDEVTTTSSTEVFTWYEEYVIDEVIADFQEEYGMSSTEAWNKVYNGGLSIYIAVDLEMQDYLEDVYENRTGFPSADEDSYGMLPQSSMTIMDYEGRIVALVGGTGEKTANRVYNRATDSSAKRQPGSSIKPLSVYAPAVDLGLITSSTLILDEALTIDKDNDGTEESWPINYAGDYGSGEYITVEYALAKSLNTVPATILSQMLGVSTSYEYCNENFHLDLNAYDEALSPLAVGGTNSGVTTLEMASAYATFGNGGYYYEPYSYYTVEERSTGKVLLDNTTELPEQVISTYTSETLLSMMTSAVTETYGTAYGSQISGFQTFAKTGTTSDNCDKWYCGGTPYYVTAVWYGYDYRADLNTGGTNPAKTIFTEVFSSIHEDLDSKTFDDVQTDAMANLEELIGETY